MSNVIDLASRLPHMEGQAVCLNCAHKWVSVSPIGVCHLECPECGTMKGVYNNLCEPEEGTAVWTCKCECYHFILREDRIMCAHCGEVQSFPNII